MVTSNHGGDVKPVWQSPLMFQCSKCHRHASPYYKCPADLPDGGLSFGRGLPFHTIQTPVHQHCQSLSEQQPQLHEALNGLRHHRAAWDISEEPLVARCITSRGVSEPIPAVVLSQPATRPAIRGMRIISESFPWEVRIHIPKSIQDRVITVGLVLQAIHGVFQEDLDAEEWEKKSTTLKKKVHMEMCARLSRAEPSLEAKIRVLKVDCLLGNTEFMGLESVDPGEDATWQLSLGPCVR